jgi:hypothetical protein
MAQNGNQLIAKADPSKAFFIDTLTRDISLSVCILDLIDNSIHGLIAGSKLDVVENMIAGKKVHKTKARIDISFDGSSFMMVDDCGGISIDDAKDRVFLLGNPIAEKTQAGLGVYGIGMKRAFFKIGSQVSFESHTQREALKIDIDVEAWKKTRAWDFPFAYGRPKKSAKGGTKISITELHPAVKSQFASNAFKSILLHKISVAYSLFLAAGLRIKVNGQQAKADMPELAASRNLRPVRFFTKLDGVEILIMAGLSPVSDRTPRGWYIFCNGRLILDADKTADTGWGTDGHPVFRSKHNHFLGYVHLRSKDLRKLPWTTTKDGVDIESRVYQAALSEMWVLSRPILNFLNDIYPDVTEESEPEHGVFRSAKALAPQKLAAQKNAVWTATVKKESDDALVSIQYRRPRKKLKKIKDFLGRSSISASGVGEYTFDWFYDKNCK